MRITFACYLEVNAGLADPAFFEQIAKYDSGKGIDSGAWVDRHPLPTIEIEQDLPEGKLQHLAFRRAERFADLWAIDAGVTDWRSYGRVVIERIENRPITYPQGVAEGPNYAIRCPNCGGPVIKRKSGKGPFWACPDYPQCRGSRPYSE